MLITQSYTGGGVYASAAGTGEGDGATPNISSKDSSAMARWERQTCEWANEDEAELSHLPSEVVLHVLGGLLEVVPWTRRTSRILFRRSKASSTRDDKNMDSCRSEWDWYASKRARLQATMFFITTWIDIQSICSTDRSYYLAMFNFNANGPCQISLQLGDVVKITEQSEKWFRGALILGGEMRCFSQETLKQIITIRHDDQRQGDKEGHIPTQLYRSISIPRSSAEDHPCDSLRMARLSSNILQGLIDPWIWNSI